MAIDELPYDMVLSLEEIMVENRFKIEEHTIKTTDGYHLKLFRIIGKQESVGHGFKSE